MGRSVTSFLKNEDLFRTGRQSFFLPGTFTFVVPSFVYQLFGIVIGAGGSGSADVSLGVGGGGRGGGYASGVINVNPGQSIVVTVGTGGASRTSNDWDGLNGTTSSIGTFLTATGGRGGHSDAQSNYTYGGAGSTSNVSFPFTSSGGNGGLNWYNANYMSSGGGSSGTPFGNGFYSGSLGSNNQASGGAGWGGDNGITPDVPTLILGAGGNGKGNISTINTSGTLNGEEGIFLPTDSGHGDTLGFLTGNSSWWFPWEADGSAGASVAVSSGSVTAFNGGFGSGGGAALITGGSPGIVIGGNGGFGGGGGGIASGGGFSQGSRAGSGGIGGGGGGSNNVNAVSGEGGNGCALIYW